MLKQTMIVAAFVAGVFCSNHLMAQTAELENGVLTIEARNGVDQQFVIRPGTSTNNSGQISNIVVVMPNGSLPTEDLNLVNKIVFLGGSGNDTCEIEPNENGLTLAATRRRWNNLPPLEVEMYGNGGRDTLTGADTDDLLFGGDGVDTLDAGSKGDDLIVGGANGDRFHVYFHWGNVNGFVYPTIHSTFPADYNYASGDRLKYHYEFYFSPRFRFRF